MITEQIAKQIALLTSDSESEIDINEISGLKQNLTAKHSSMPIKHHSTRQRTSTAKRPPPIEETQSTSFDR